MMNPFLNDIFAQPSELRKVLNSLCGENRASAQRIAALLKAAPRVILTSMGSAYYSLMPMFYELQKRRGCVELWETSELMNPVERIDPSALYVVMSRSGESYEIAHFPQMLQKAGAKCVGITMTPDSTLAKHCDVLLVDPADYDALICTKAYTSMALCGLFCVSEMDAAFDAAAERSALYGMFDWMEKNKTAMLGQIEEMTWLSDVSGLYLLSRGYGMGVVHSGALWIEEASRKCACVSTLDGFYHGPIEIAQTDVLPLLLDAIPTPRSAMIWHRINEIAPHTIQIGTTASQEPNCSSIVIPDFGAGDGYQMIAQAMAFQLLAYHNAVLGHLDAGALATVSWVIQ